ncbi:MAG: hypothetical protein ABDI19_07935 [Armatimonadota bacterium]
MRETLVEACLHATRRWVFTNRYIKCCYYRQGRRRYGHAMRSVGVSPTASQRLKRQLVLA